MTREIAKRIVKGITDKIECNTADIDDWAEFWGFTREEYEEFLDMPIKALEQEPKTGHWIKGYTFPDGAYWKCDKCNELIKVKIPMRYCNNCGCRMVEPQESEET